MSYYLKGKGGGRPEHERLERPADPDGHASLRAFLDEHAFWEINEPLRRLVYCFINGAVSAAKQPELADEILRALAPDFEVLFPYLETLEGAYVGGFDATAAVFRAENTRAFRAAQQRAFGRVLVRAGELGANPDIECWCALQFCAGVVAQQRGTLVARHTVRRFNAQYDHAERHLFAWVTMHALGWDCFTWVNPLFRFVAACYPTTPVEGSVIPALLARLSEDIPPGSPNSNPFGVFSTAFRVGLSTAQSDPGMLATLLEDIEQGIGPGCAAENGRIFREEMGLPAVDDLPMELLWQAAKRNIARRYPHLDPYTRHYTRRIQIAAYTQCIVDTAFWAGLYAGCPAAFDDYPAWKAARFA